MDDSINLFNRDLYRLRRTRAGTEFGRADFLKREAAARIADSLDDIKREFPLALDLGCHWGEMKEALRGSTRVGKLIGSDHALSMRPQIVCDEEQLPFAPNMFDLVTSALSLHHVNDLVGTLIQLRACLKPDGLLLAILPGPRTLHELRESAALAAAAHNFALSPLVSPFAEVRDAGALLQRAGFALPVIDSDTITVSYDTPFKLMLDLRAMGESNVLHAGRKTFTSRRQLNAIAEAYQSHFANPDGTIRATFEFITLTAWKPHASQQQASKRGSGQLSLVKALK